MTFDMKLNGYYCTKSSENVYESVYTPDEYDDMVVFCKKVFEKEFTNEIGVRIDSFTEKNGSTELKLSQVRFYDFITSNFTLFNINVLRNRANAKETKLLEKLVRAFEQDGAVTSIPDLLSRNYFSNTLAVSCLLKDTNGQYLLTKRNGKTGISNYFYSTTVTGAVDGQDFLAEDSLKNCCIREFMEEINYKISPYDIIVHRIVAGEKKMQPIVLANVMVDDANNVISQLREHKGFSEENSSFCITDKNGLKKLLFENDSMITEAVKTHLETEVI